MGCTFEIHFGHITLTIAAKAVYFDVEHTALKCKIHWCSFNKFQSCTFELFLFKSVIRNSFQYGTASICFCHDHIFVIFILHVCETERVQVNVEVWMVWQSPVIGLHFFIVTVTVFSPSVTGLFYILVVYLNFTCTSSIPASIVR